MTLRDVRTLLDVKPHRMFGQGISSSCDPQLTLEGLRQATVAMREEDIADRNRAAVVAAAIGAGAGFASFDRAREKKSNNEVFEMIRSVAIPTISATASYFYLRHLKNRIRQHRDEMEAREFFSKKSASGNKYT